MRVLYVCVLLLPSHDIAAYLATKEPDITTMLVSEDGGAQCPEYAAFGFCASGFQCRLGDCHIDRVNLVNKRRPEVRQHTNHIKTPTFCL